MNKDQVKGSMKDAAGKVQGKFGEGVDSPEHKVKGEARQAEGETQKKVGDVKEGVKNITRMP